MYRCSVRGEVPILMYHAFGADEPASRFVVPSRSFRRQLVVMRLLGYRPVRLTAYAKLRREGRPPPRRSFVLTIDDGYVDVGTVAVPLLRRHRVSATLFIPSAFVGRRNEWDNPDAPLYGRPILPWDELAALSSELDLGAHSRTHPRLPDLGIEDATREIDGSRADIHAALGVLPDAFAYPYGSRTDALEATVEALGFICACSVGDGLNTSATPLYALRRIEIFGTDTLFRFVLKVWTGRREPRRADVRRRLLPWARRR
jgi:peptidoglycan/xylan/chitin deacetylase (PgdA/CDA1 family)